MKRRVLSPVLVALGFALLATACSSGKNEPAGSSTEPLSVGPHGWGPPCGTPAPTLTMAENMDAGDDEAVFEGRGFVHFDDCWVATGADSVVISYVSVDSNGYALGPTTSFTTISSNAGGLSVGNVMATSFVCTSDAPPQQTLKVYAHDDTTDTWANEGTPLLVTYFCHQ
jgi:hypothetical protein